MVIKGYNRRWQTVVEYHSIDEVVGMAYGVREDISNGKRGLIPNWCATQSGVVMWDVIE